MGKVGFKEWYCKLIYIIPHLLTLVLGVGSIKPNEGGDNEDGDPEELADSAWMQLLDEEDGVYSLKPWEQVLELKANGNNIGQAFREFIRQAWSECGLIMNIHFLNQISVSSTIRQKGEGHLG